MSYKVYPKRRDVYRDKLYGASINFAREAKSRDARININGTAYNIYSDALKDRKVANFLLKNFLDKEFR